MDIPLFSIEMNGKSKLVFDPDATQKNSSLLRNS